MVRPMTILRRTGFAAILLTAVLASCDRHGETLRILTDRKELASAIEMYDSIEPDLTISWRMVGAIDADILEDARPDLVIGSHLAAPEILDQLEPRTDEGPASFLDGPADAKGRPRLHALSYRLPLVMGRADSMATLPDPVAVRIDALMEAGLAFDERDGDGRMVRMGFSPAWDPQTAVDLTLIRAPEAFAGGLGQVDEKDVGPVVDEMRAWIEASAGSVDADAAFSERYRYIPDEYLILERRIGYARTDFEDWALLPDAIARQLDIRYLMGDRHIPVLGVVSAGIPSSGRRSEAARRFVAWLLEADTQKALMERWERERNRLAASGREG